MIRGKSNYGLIKKCSRLLDKIPQTRLVITRRRFELTYSLTEVHSHQYNRTVKDTTENINHYTRGAKIPGAIVDMATKFYVASPNICAFSA